jgi:eukaryotic-like serine/threonine-protein kinase
MPANIGRYTVEAKVGGGGMAAVYRARPPEDLRDAMPEVVAIKTLLPEFASDPEFRAMFEEEAEISGQLQHDNVVGLYDFGQTNDGALFLVMEWVDGLDLGQVLRSFRHRRLRMNPPIACAILEQALRGLHAAHSRVDRDGNPLVVVHRDVSPANILVSHQGIVKIADFGLARPLNRMRRTLPGIVKGKFAYLAPEQTFDRMVDPRTDVFAAGIVLWEALASRHLFRRATDLKTVLAIRDGRIRDVRKYAPGLDERVVEALHQALQQDPDKRFPTANAFADALGDYLATVRPVVDAKVVAAVVEDVLRAEAVELQEPRPSRLSLPRVTRKGPPPLPKKPAPEVPPPSAAESSPFTRTSDPFGSVPDLPSPSQKSEAVPLVRVRPRTSRHASPVMLASSRRSRS